MLYRTVDEAIEASLKAATCNRAAAADRAAALDQAAAHSQAAAPSPRAVAEARAHAEQYRLIRDDFLDAIAQFGLDVADADPALLTPASPEVDALANGSPTANALTVGDPAGSADAPAAQPALLHIDNNRASLWLNWLSPACVACRRGVGTETFLISTRCPKQCFFCFNPNQEGYDYYRTHVRDVAADLQREHDRGARLTHLALTGGEPLLHRDQTLSFFERARALYPDAHTRLYTCGFDMDDATARALRDAGLNEVRFSVKTGEPPAEQRATLDAIARCVGLFDAVMVEMPVMPDELLRMQDLLVELDSLGVTGINLLELCFPFNNAPEFAQRGYRIKHTPYRVLYNYWYGGGLPVEGSEDACLRLLRFARDRRLTMGVHYCSLENKLTGQIYQQNAPFARSFPPHELSARDYFLKSARLFGEDARAAGADELPPSQVPALASAAPHALVGITSCVVEQREDGRVLRELDVAFTTPTLFDPARDV